jgi:hypothetical protein
MAHASRSRYIHDRQQEGELDAASETLRQSVQNNEVNDRAYLSLGAITEQDGVHWQNFKIHVANIGHVPSYFDATLNFSTDR